MSGAGSQSTTLFPYTTLFRSGDGVAAVDQLVVGRLLHPLADDLAERVRVLAGVEQRDGAGERLAQGVVRALLVLGERLRSEEHTSELQSPMYLVCRLLLEKKK